MPSYKLPNFLREEFARPLGLVVATADVNSYLSQLQLKDEALLSVGDRTTDFFVSHGRRPCLQIIDSREKRMRRAPPLGGYDRLIHIANPPGEITGEAIEVIRQELGKGGASRILVDGEEDLLVLPAIYFAPEGADVFYGQPNQGMVHVKADVVSKKRVAEMMASMGYLVPK